LGQWFKANVPNWNRTARRGFYFAPDFSNRLNEPVEPISVQDLDITIIATMNDSTSTEVFFEGVVDNQSESVLKNGNEPNGMIEPSERRPER
jgi:hypothetical protein